MQNRNAPGQTEWSLIADRLGRAVDKRFALQTFLLIAVRVVPFLAVHRLPAKCVWCERFSPSRFAAVLC